MVVTNIFFLKRIRLTAFILVVLMFFSPAMGGAENRKIALLVDNSGSMYGRCSGVTCNDVMEEVKLALKNVLPLLYAYNREQDKEQQVEPVLVLFGGYSKGQEEFREIALTQDLAKDLELLERELIPSSSYNDTNFTLALKRTLEILEKRGKASCTVFLTDATSGHPVDDMNFSLFGRTFFYALNRNTIELDDLATRYEKSGLQAEVNYLEHGWEITSSFVKAFLMLQQPKEGNHYFFHEDIEIESQPAIIELTKMTTASATFHLIFHGKSAPVFKSLFFDSKALDPVSYTMYQGPNILTLKLNKDSPAGQYSVNLGKTPGTKQISLFGIEAATLQLLEREHIKPGKNYKKNEEVVFNFSFGVMDKEKTVFLTDEQNKAFKNFVHVNFLIEETKGADNFKSKDDLNHFTIAHVFNPKNSDDSEYTIKTGWSYLNSNPVPDMEVGKFVLTKDPAQLMKLDFYTDTPDQKFWQGRSISVKAKWDNSSLPTHYADISEIEIRDTTTDEHFWLQLDNEKLFFVKEIGKHLAPGKHIFELVTPDPDVGSGVSLKGKELTVLPRIFELKIEEITERSGKTKDGIYNKLKNGFLYLTGNKKKQRIVEKYQVKKFPYTKEIHIPYYDANIHVMKVQGALKPVFKDETYVVETSYNGPDSYTAKNARIPEFFGLFKGEPMEIDDALLVRIVPDKTQMHPERWQTIEFIKKECDWEINDLAATTPGITYTPKLIVAGEDINLTRNKVFFSLSTQSWDKEIISTLRASAFIAFFILTMIFFLMILAFLIFLRSHSLHRQEQWETICKMMPEDFCQPGYFSQKAYKICEDRSVGTGRTPRETLSRSIRDNDKKFLSKLCKAFSLNELKILKERCKSSNFDSVWEFSVAGGTTVTVYGSELNSSPDCIRLRDLEGSLPQALGSITARQANNGMELKFNPRPEVVFRLKDTLFIPPYNGASVLQSGDVMLIGRHKGELPLAVTVSAYEDSLIIQCQKR
jgi:hypothetical protein